jgi:hypothetical protein
MHTQNARTRVLVAMLAIATVCIAAAQTVQADGNGRLRSGNLLIVAASGYVGSAPLDEYIATKTAQGFNVMLYNVPTGTSRTVIKDYIVNLWGSEDAPDYVLLVGDTSGASSTTTTIPHWIGGGSKSADTDMPYVCMPGGVEWYPDLSIGRFSVTSVSQLENVVNKTLFVEAGSFTDPDYTKRGAFLANPDTAGLAEPTHDWVIDTYFVPNDYEGIRIYSAQGGNTGDVTNAVNNGCMFCVYMGHSSSSGWWDPSFTQANINALSNAGLYGLVFGWSCNTAHYSYDECFGETWQRAANRGAAAYISASNYIYWGSYDAWLPSAVHEKSFFASFFEKDIWEVGPAWVAGLYKFLTDYGAWDGNLDHTPPQNLSVCRNFVEEFTLLGDPTLLLPRPALSIDLPDGIPEYMPPGTPTTLTIRVRDGSEAYVPDSGQLYYRYDGGDFLTTPLTPAGDELFEATLPAAVCGDEPEFYVSAEGDGGTIVTSPINAPASLYSMIVGTPVFAIDDNFETDLGWTAVNLGASSGDWERGVPVNDGSWQYDPLSDSDGSGQCYLTENDYGNTDVDGGAVQLISPTIDMSVAGVTIRYDYFFNLTSADGTDRLLVEINNSDGEGEWIEIARHDTSGGLDWRHHDITQADLDAAGVVLTPTMRVRFTANDGDPQSIVEAAIDAFQIVAFACGDCPGDLDGDDDVDLADLAQLLAHYGMTGMTYEDGDLDADGDVDLSDLSALLAVYGTTCP